MALATLSAKISPELMTQIDALVGEGQSKSSIVAQLLATALSDRPPSPDDEPIEYSHPALETDDRAAQLDDEIRATIAHLDRLLKARTALDWGAWRGYFRRREPETIGRLFQVPRKCLHE